MKHFICTLFWACCCAGISLVGQAAHAQEQPVQDTLRLTLPQAEALFLQRNFSLLAQKYNISVAEAAVVQAKLFPNPQASFEYNAYNPATKKLFPTDASPAGNGYKGGQYIVSVQQLVQLAGQRSKLASLAQADQQLATYQFADVVRTLRLVLRSTYAGLYYNQQAQRLYSQELQRLLQLVQATRLAEQQGIVSAYDVTRLEAEAQDFAGSIAALGATMAAQAADLKLLLADASPSYLLLTQEPPQRQVVVGPAWRDSVLLLRPDYLYAKAGIRRAGLNLTYQRAQATPNLVAGYNYESLGNAYTNYHGLSVGLELPFFSRNQGQIKAARIGQQAAENALAQAQAVVYTDVETARRSLVAYQTQAQAIPPGYSGRIGRLSQQADQAYRSRTIGLLDYLDKFRTYKTGSANNLELQKNLFIATETLATALGTP